MGRFKVWFAPTQEHRKMVFADADWERLCSEFEVTVNGGENLTSEQLAAGSAGFWGIITGWGVPELTEQFFVNDPDLKVIAHSAGSIKYLVSKHVVEQYLVPRGITTFSGNSCIAENVAEAAIGLLLMTARRWITFNNHYHETGDWRKPGLDANTQGLLGSTVGVVSASEVGKNVIRLLQPWDLKVICYDPYVSAEKLAELGAEKVELDELFARADHVTVHAPITPETEKMIGARQLGLMKHGADLVNTSRGWVIDHDALLAEAQSGRIWVCLDVTTPEPLPADSPFRGLPNVYITPHISGAGRYGYLQLGQRSVDALESVREGRAVRGAVDYPRYDILA